jgi:sterol desaturase/sphingolipid hydroxylase (fatty acid hydroxylase superfamily)
MITQSGRRFLGAVDRMIYSPANYWSTMLGDMAAALAFLAFGIHRFSGHIVVACGLVVVGFFFSGLFEYAMHRWVLHGPPSMARRGHAQHHAEPTALVSTPLFVFGLYAGYNYFALIHHLQHHASKDLARVSYWRQQERHHHLHHHRHGVNFGISTTLWDRLFGTFEPASEPATDYVLWSVIRSFIGHEKTPR